MVFVVKVYFVNDLGEILLIVFKRLLYGLLPGQVYKFIGIVSIILFYKAGAVFVGRVNGCVEDAVKEITLPELLSIEGPGRIVDRPILGNVRGSVADYFYCFHC